MLLYLMKSYISFICFQLILISENCKIISLNSHDTINPLSIDYTYSFIFLRMLFFFIDLSIQLKREIILQFSEMRINWKQIKEM
jgi:hypothetical protein